MNLCLAAKDRLAVIQFEILQVVEHRPEFMSLTLTVLLSMRTVAVCFEGSGEVSQASLCPVSHQNFASVTKTVNCCRSRIGGMKAVFFLG